MKALIAIGVVAVAGTVFYKCQTQSQKNDLKYVATCLTGVRFDRM